MDASATVMDGDEAHMLYSEQPPESMPATVDPPTGGAEPIGSVTPTPAIATSVERNAAAGFEEPSWNRFVDLLLGDVRINRNWYCSALTGNTVSGLTSTC